MKAYYKGREYDSRTRAIVDWLGDMPGELQAILGIFGGIALFLASLTILTHR